MLTIRFLTHAFSIRVYCYTCVKLILGFPLISLHISGQRMYLYASITSLDMYTCACLYMPHGLIFVLIRLLLTTMDLHVQILELGASKFSPFLIRVAQWKRGSSADHPEPFSSRPPARLSNFPIIARERPFVLLILVYRHHAFALWFLFVLILSLYMWGYLRTAYICRSNISVPARSGHTTYLQSFIRLCHSASHDSASGRPRSSWIH